MILVINTLVKTIENDFFVVYYRLYKYERYAKKKTYNVSTNLTPQFLTVFGIIFVYIAVFVVMFDSQYFFFMFDSEIFTYLS